MEIAIGGGSIFVGIALPTTRDAVAFAELKELSPAFVAEIEQVPAPTAVSVVPEMVHTDVVEEE